MKNIFTQLINEYKPRVSKGKLSWEVEPILPTQTDSALPDSFSDIPNLKNIKAGKSAQLPNAKMQRNISNSIRNKYT